jgi:hypothetical protein
LVPGSGETDPQRAEIRRCRDPKAFCVELSVRARVIERATDRTLGDMTYLYSNPQRVPDGGLRQIWRKDRAAKLLAKPETHPIWRTHSGWRYTADDLPTEPNHGLWEKPTAETAPCRPIEALCGADAAAKLEQEFARGVDAIAGRLLRDLGY